MSKMIRHYNGTGLLGGVLEVSRRACGQQG
jgi:hypothetical protein